jgi:hypothetical protein
VTKTSKGQWRNPRRANGTLMLTLALLLCLGHLSGIARAQDYLTANGAKAPTAPDPTQMGYVETSNGSLQLDIPLGSYPQRGSAQPLTFKVEYNGDLWQNSGSYWSLAGLESVGGWLQTSPSTGYAYYSEVFQWELHT